MPVKSLLIHDRESVTDNFVCFLICVVGCQKPKCVEDCLSGYMAGRGCTQSGDGGCAFHWVFCEDLFMSKS
jgi:hypothetical protein